MLASYLSILIGVRYRQAFSAGAGGDHRGHDELQGEDNDLSLMTMIVTNDYDKYLYFTFLKTDI